VVSLMDGYIEAKYHVIKLFRGLTINRN
jgi:hypothetical protein